MAPNSVELSQQQVRRSLQLLAVLAGIAAVAAAVDLPCQKTTGIKNCAECRGSSCYLCAQAISDPTIAGDGSTVACGLSFGGKACQVASGDTNCSACSRQDRSCVRCTNGFQLNTTTGICARKGCRLLSKNVGCAMCNPDGSCKRCKLVNRGMLVVPEAAQYINRVHPYSNCMWPANVIKLSEKLFHQSIWLPDNCAEVNMHLQCVGCRDGFMIAPSQDQCMESNSTCLSQPYGQYCTRCNEKAAKCTACVDGHNLDSTGLCSLNCQAMFGFFCSQCTTVGTTPSCTKLYAQSVFEYFVNVVPPS